MGFTYARKSRKLHHVSGMIASDALEFEVMLGRAVRQGRLDVDDVVPAYRGLQPASHLGLRDRRRVDLGALRGALQALPAGFFACERVLVAARIGGFRCTPVPGGDFSSGRLADGTLIIEARQGNIDLAAIAGHLCAVVCEKEKVEALRGGGQPDDGVQNVSRLAFSWGVDEAGLRAADAATQGALLPLLCGTQAIPVLDLHPDLATEGQRQRAQGRAARVVTSVAEMGLTERPLHLWLGSDAIIGCLSPYARDLRAPLLRWAATSPPGLGADLVGHLPADDDFLAALAWDFAQTSPTLRPERIAADRSVGLLHHVVDDLRCEIVDLARVDPDGCDARIRTLAWQASDAVIVRIEPLAEDGDGACLEALLETLGPRVASVTVERIGATPAGSPGAVVLPRLLIARGGAYVLPLAEALGGASGLHPAEVSASSACEVLPGSVLSLPAASLLSSEMIATLGRRFGVSAVEVGGRGLADVLVHSLWRGLLAEHCEIAFVVVNAVTCATGRPTLPSLAGLHAVALARLRRMVGESASQPEPDAAPAAPPERAPVSPSSAASTGSRAWAMRIKA